MTIKLVVVVNSDRCLEILNDGVVSFVEELFASELGSDMITVAPRNPSLFMRDNASCHVPAKVTEFLRKEQIPVTAQSPELNSIKSNRTSLDHKELKHF